jgi:hypothetical protein
MMSATLYGIKQKKTGFILTSNGAWLVENLCSNPKSFETATAAGLFIIDNAMSYDAEWCVLTHTG